MGDAPFSPPALFGCRPPVGFRTTPNSSEQLRGTLARVKGLDDAFLFCQSVKIKPIIEVIAGIETISARIYFSSISSNFQRIVA
jgi:hypothetical protein